MLRSLRSRRAAALAGSLALGALAGCGDDPHFDADQYQIITTSVVLRDNANAAFLNQPETWLYEVSAYVPSFCSPTSTTTATNGRRTVQVNWTGCAYGGRDLVGELEYVGDGEYEGLLHVTFPLNGTDTEFDVWFNLVPHAPPP